MFSKPPQCSRCRVSYFSQGFVADSSHKAKKLAIMMDTPDKESMLRGTPWTSKQAYVWKETMFKHVGLVESDVLFSHVLRCLPDSSGEFPKGVLGKHGTDLCRQYDSELLAFNPNVIICTESVKDLQQRPALYRLIRADLKKAYEFYTMGYRPLVAMGIEAVRLVLPWISSAKAWRGHWEELNGWPYSGVSQERPDLVKVWRSIRKVA